MSQTTERDLLWFAFNISFNGFNLPLNRIIILECSPKRCAWSNAEGVTLESLGMCFLAPIH